MKIAFKKVALTTLCIVASQLYAQNDMLDGSLEDLMSMETDLKAEIGSRDGAKDLLNSSLPVDVITSTQIESSGLTSLTDILRYFVAGFNAPETSVADGSDHVRVFTLRGMGSDQVLVLINGKRVHTSALLHVNGTIGRGSANVDLDTIIPSSIKKIEILRDGAAAQYGSDAIAGVINIILKGANEENSVSVHAGERKEGDGRAVVVDTFITTPLRYDGFINVAFQAKKQEQTNRAGNDNRLDPPRVTTHVGIPDSTNYLATLNIEVPQISNQVLYADATFNYRDSEASAFFRPSDHDENTTLIYPNGFLPMLSVKILDYSITAGINGEFSDGTFWDFSNTYGFNSIHHYVDNSMNYSLGAESPTSFDNGILSFLQNTTNLDFKKSLDKLQLASGLEYRYEEYSIEAGDESSYIDGGSQGFPGYCPASEVDEDRNSYALYLDATYNFNDDFSLEGATRYENYSDFGSTTNVKIATGYKITSKILVRISASTGFRAPSLAQSNYSNIATFGGVTSGTFQPSAEVSKELGAKDLTAEKSRHFTIGSVYRATDHTSFMLDYFLVDVDERIMLSNAQTLTPEQQEKYQVKTVSYFTNAVDTKTYGIDFKITNQFRFENDSVLDMSLWYSYSKNEVLDFHDDSITRDNSYEQIDRVENGQPKHSIKLLSTYMKNKMKYVLNLNAFSSYSQVIDDKSYIFEKEWTADLDISYKMKKNATIAFGGNNIFDAIPNKWDGLSSKYYGYDSIKPYSRYSPFGYSGAYYYVRVKIAF